MILAGTEQDAQFPLRYPRWCQPGLGANLMNDDLIEQIESHLNEQGAEMTALKIILLGLVCRVAVADPMFAEVAYWRFNALTGSAPARLNSDNS
jgi:hypothetical protein